MVMEKREIRTKILGLNKDAEDIQIEIDYIKNICDHEDYKISLHDFGQVEVVQRVCIYCGKPIG